MKNASLFLALGLLSMAALPASAAAAKPYVSGYFQLMLEGAQAGLIERTEDAIARELLAHATDLDDLLLFADFDDDGKPDEFDPEKRIPASDDVIGDEQLERLYQVDLDKDGKLELFALNAPEDTRAKSGNEVAIESLELAYEGLKAVAIKARIDKLPNSITGPINEATNRAKRVLESVVSVDGELGGGLYGE